MLEINARPGLNIQIANQQGLLHRLEKVELDHGKLTDLSARLEYAVNNFG
jgi:hypothetical protein